MRPLEEIKSDIQLLEADRASIRNKESEMTKTLVALRNEMFDALRNQKIKAKKSINVDDIRKNEKDRRDKILQRILSGESIASVARSENRSRTSIEHAARRAMSDAGIPLGFSTLAARLKRANEILGGVR